MGAHTQAAPYISMGYPPNSFDTQELGVKLQKSDVTVTLNGNSTIICKINEKLYLLRNIMEHFTGEILWEFFVFEANKTSPKSLN